MSSASVRAEERHDAKSEEMRLGRGEFLNIIKSGKDNNYQVPIEDRKMSLLTSPIVNFTEESRKHRLSGVVVVEAEFLADGRIVNAHALNRLGDGLDEDAITSVYRIVFIPMIEDGHFKDSTNKVKVTYFQH